MNSPPTILLALALLLSSGSAVAQNLQLGTVTNPAGASSGASGHGSASWWINTWNPGRCTSVFGAYQSRPTSTASESLARPVWDSGIASRPAWADLTADPKLLHCRTVQAGLDPVDFDFIWELAPDITECPTGYLPEGSGCIYNSDPPPPPDYCTWNSPDFDYQACDWVAYDAPQGSGDLLGDPYTGCDAATDPYGCLGPPEPTSCDPATDPFGCGLPDPISLADDGDPTTPAPAPVCPSGYRVGEWNGNLICQPARGDITCPYGKYLNPATNECSSEPWKTESSSSTKTTETRTEVVNADGSVTTETTTEKRDEVQAAELPDLYTQGERSIPDAFGDFGTRVAAAPFISGAGSFFDFSLSAGNCPTYSATVPIFGVIVFDHFCSSAMVQIWPMISAILFAVFGFFAFRIAFM